MARNKWTNDVESLENYCVVNPIDLQNLKKKTVTYNTIICDLN